jgi:hypothetical protein
MQDFGFNPQHKKEKKGNERKRKEKGGEREEGELEGKRMGKTQNNLRRTNTL